MNCLQSDEYFSVNTFFLRNWLLWWWLCESGHCIGVSCVAIYEAGVKWSPSRQCRHMLSIASAPSSTQLNRAFLKRKLTKGLWHMLYYNLHALDMADKFVRKWLKNIERSGDSSWRFAFGNVSLQELGILIELQKPLEEPTFSLVLWQEKRVTIYCSRQ